MNYLIQEDLLALFAILCCLVFAFLLKTKRKK